MSEVNVLNPKRFDSESQEDYRLRQKLIKKVLKEHKRGRTIHQSIQIVEDETGKQIGIRGVTYEK